MSVAPRIETTIACRCALLTEAPSPSCPECLGTGKRPVPVVAPGGCRRHGRFPSPPLLFLAGIPCPYCFADAAPLRRYIRTRNELRERAGDLSFREGDGEEADAYFGILYEGGRFRAIEQATRVDPEAFDGVRGINPGPLAVHPGFVRVVGLSIWPTFWADLDGGFRRDADGENRFRAYGIAWAWIEVPPR